MRPYAGRVGAQAAGAVRTLQSLSIHRCAPVLLGLVFIIGCGDRAADSDTTRVRFGDRILQVSQNARYVPTGGLASASALSTDASIDNINLLVPIDRPQDGEEFAPELADHILLRLTADPSQQIKYERLSNDAKEAWNLAGPYADARFRYDRNMRLYRIARRDQSGQSWHYFSAKPTANGDWRQEWRGLCRASSIAGASEGLTNVACQTIVPFSDGQARITFAGRRIGCFGSIMARVMEIVANQPVT